MKLSVLIIIFCCSSLSLFAQNLTEAFAITPPERPVAHSLYRTLTFLDSRNDTTDMGIVQLGAFNRKARVVAEMPLSNQLSHLMTVITDETAGNGELLFQLRQLSFAEITGGTSERGYCYMRASIYDHNGDIYHNRGFIDTVILVRAMDVTHALFRNASHLFTDFLAATLTAGAPAAVKGYTYYDIVQIDSIEKGEMAVYNTNKYPDGYYPDYSSFASLVPGGIAMVDMRNNTIYGVTTQNEKGKKEKLKSKDIYAVVYNGTPYVSTQYGYYPLHKENNDFFFTGKASIAPSTGQQIAAGVFMGLLGALMMQDANALFVMKIDHLNGSFIKEERVQPERRQ